MLIRCAAATLMAATLAAVPALARNPPGPPWPDGVSRGGITLRWYPDDVSEGAAQRFAGEYCAQTGRVAAFAALERDGSVELGTYRCVWRRPPGHVAG